MTKKKSGGRGPRDKGNKYENSIAKRLDTWLKDRFGLIGDIRYFSRTPRSGGWRTDVPQGLEDKIVGDLVTPYWWPWAIECKDQKTWSFPAWIKQIKGEIADVGSSKSWMIVAHEHGTRNDYVLMPFDVFIELLGEAIWNLVSDDFKKHWGLEDPGVPES